MDFKSQLKNAGSNKEEKILKVHIDDLYEEIKRRCMRSAEWGYTKIHLGLKEMIAYQASGERFPESDFDAIFRHREDGCNLDYSDRGMWVFKSPDTIVEMLKEKLKADKLLENSNFKYKKTKLVKTKSKWVESIYSGNHIATKRIPYADAVSEIELNIDWEDEENILE